MKAAVSRLTGEPRLADVILEVTLNVAGRSAILEKLAMAHQSWEQGGIDRELDQDFWRGVEDLMRANRDDLQRLEDVADKS